MEEKPNYYAVIPANVRYDNDLNANSKLLYGEISALSNKYGYCVATNEYFSNLYSVSTRTITDWIKQLEVKHYVRTEIETKRYEDGTIKKVRKTYINHIEKEQQDHIEDLPQDHIEENFSYNNTSNINNINKKENNKRKSYGEYKRVKLTDKEYQKLIDDYGKERIDRQIQEMDKYVESNNNKNKYSNFNLVLRKSIREKWFKGNIKEEPEWFYKDLDKEDTTLEEKEELDKLLSSMTER